MIKEQLISHFANPHGPLGWVAGRIMATRDTNVERNRWMVGQLAPAVGARILEIGHGPGLAIEQLWGGLDGGQITGVDVSALMSRTAARRNRDGVAAGVVHFEVADSSVLPDSLRDFDLIFGVNASMFWTDPSAAVVHLVSRLATHGELVLAYMPPPTSDQSAESAAAEMVGWFQAAGLTEITESWMDFDPPTVAVRAHR